MAMINSKRRMNLMQPKAPLPPMTIPPVIEVQIKEPSEVDYHTDDEASEVSTRPSTQQNVSSVHENQTTMEQEEGVEGVSALQGAHITSTSKTTMEGVSTLNSTTGHALKLQQPQKVSFSTKPPATVRAMKKMAPIREERRGTTRSRHNVPTMSESYKEAAAGGPLPLSDVRRTQRRVAALLQQTPNGIVQPTKHKKSPRKHQKPRAFHFCMCSRMDPDGLFRDPALNFLREGLKNVGKDFPDFIYTQRRGWRAHHGPTTAQSMDDALLPRSPLLSPIRDPYTGRHSSKGVLSPGDITDFDYRKLKNLVLARGKLPKISDNQKVTNPNNTFLGRGNASQNTSRVPGNTPIGTAELRDSTRMQQGTNNEESGGNDDTVKHSNDANDDNTENSTARKPKKSRVRAEGTKKKSEDTSKMHTSQVTGLRPEASFKPKPFDGSIPTKSKGAMQKKPFEGSNPAGPFDGGKRTNPFEGSNPAGPFDGAIRTKPFEGAMQTKPVATKSHTQVSERQDSAQPQSSGYETDGAIPASAPRLRKEGSSFLRAPTLPHELSIVGSGHGSREPTMYQDYTYIRTEATRSTTPFTDGSYSFVRGREDTDDSFMMPSYAPSSESRDLFESVTPRDGDLEDDPRAILQHQYREPTNSSIDVFEKMEDLEYKFDSGTFDFSTDLNVNDIDTSLRLPKEPTAAPSELPPIPESPKMAFKHRRWGSDNRPIFPGGVREAYIKALAVAAARHRMPPESWMFGQNISRAFVFSYFDHVPHHVCPDCEKPVLPDDDDDDDPIPYKSPRKPPPPPLKIKKEMKHIFKDVEVDDYYPGGKRNPNPRMDWHGHRKAKKK